MTFMVFFQGRGSFHLQKAPNIKMQKTGAEEICNTQVRSPASDLERWADQGLDMVVPPIDSGPVAFTHLHDACPT